MANAGGTSAWQLFDSSIADQIKVWNQRYNVATARLIDWVRANSEVEVPMRPGPNDKEYADMPALQTATRDIARRSVDVPQNIRAAFAEAIGCRTEVTRKYREAEGENVSESTLGHEAFTGRLAEMQALLDTQPPRHRPLFDATPSAAAPSPAWPPQPAVSEEIEEDVQSEPSAMSIDGDELEREMDFAAWILQVVYVINQAALACKKQMASPRALAEAAWVVTGCRNLALQLCDTMMAKTGLDAQALLTSMAELRIEGKVGAIQLLPLHELVEGFDKVAGTFFEHMEIIAAIGTEITPPGQSSRAIVEIVVDDPEIPPPSVAEMIPLLQSLVRESWILLQQIPLSSRGWLKGDWFQRLPLAPRVAHYGLSREVGNEPKKIRYALMAMIDFLFLWYTSAGATELSSRKVFDSGFQKAVAFAAHVDQFITSIPGQIKLHFANGVKRELGKIQQLCYLIKDIKLGTATGLPWTVGIQILAVLDAVNGVTAPMVYQHRVVAAVVHAHHALVHTDPSFQSVPVIEAITSLMKADLFADAIRPTSGYVAAFRKFEDYSPALDPDGEWKFENKEKDDDDDDDEEEDEDEEGYHGPSVVHQVPQPFRGKSTRVNELLRKTSPSSADLPPTTEWNVIQMTEQMRLTALREFSGDRPLARVNFIAIYLFCIEVLRKFQNTEEVPFKPDIAKKSVDRVLLALAILDTAGSAGLESGHVPSLKAALESMQNRDPGLIYWPML